MERAEEEMEDEQQQRESICAAAAAAKEEKEAESDCGDIKEAARARCSSPPLYEAVDACFSPTAGAGGAERLPQRQNASRARELCRRLSGLVFPAAAGSSEATGGGEEEEVQLAQACSSPVYRLVTITGSEAKDTVAGMRLSSASNTTLSAERDSSESDISRNSARNAASDNDEEEQQQPPFAAGVAVVTSASAASAAIATARGAVAEVNTPAQLPSRNRWKPRLQVPLGGRGAGAAGAWQRQIDNLYRTPAAPAGRRVQAEAKNKGWAHADSAAADGSGAAAPGAMCDEAVDVVENRNEKLQEAAAVQGGGAEAARQELRDGGGSTSRVESPEKNGGRYVDPAVGAAAGHAAAGGSGGDEVEAGDRSPQEEEKICLSPSAQSGQLRRLLSKQSVLSRRSTTGGAGDSNLNGVFPSVEGFGVEAAAVQKEGEGEMEKPANTKSAGGERGGQGEEEEGGTEVRGGAGAGEGEDETGGDMCWSEYSDAPPASPSSSVSLYKRVVLALHWLLSCCCCCVSKQLWQRNRWLPQQVKKRRLCRCSLQVLLLLLLALLIFLPFFFAFIMPEIIKSYVEQGDVRVLSTSIRKPRPGGFEAVIAVEYLTRVPLRVKVADTEVEVYHEEQHVGRTEIPSFSLSPDTKRVTFTTDFQVLHMRTWEDFLRPLFTRGKSAWQMKGYCTVSVLGLTYRNIPLNKVMEIEGPTLSNAEGKSPFEIKHVDMSSSKADAIVATVDVEYENSTASSVESIGEVTYSMLFSNYPVGIIVSAGPIGLQPGTNKYRFVASMSFADAQRVLRTPGGAAAAARAAAARAAAEGGKGGGQKGGRSSSSGSRNAGGGGAGSRRLAASPASHTIPLGSAAGGHDIDSYAKHSDEEKEALVASESRIARDNYRGGGDDYEEGEGRRGDAPLSATFSSSRTSPFFSLKNNPLAGAAVGRELSLQTSSASPGEGGDGGGDKEETAELSQEESDNGGGDGATPAPPSPHAPSSPPSPSPEKQHFLDALSQLMTAALSGDSTANVVSEGISSTEPLFSSALQALSITSPLSGIFGDDDDEDDTHEIGRVSIKTAKTQRQKPAASRFFKSMHFHKFSLAPPVDPAAPPDDAAVAASLIVRFLNPLGASHPFSIIKVEMQTMLRRNSVDGAVLGCIRGELLPTGEPQVVPSLDAPFASPPPLPRPPSSSPRPSRKRGGGRGGGAAERGSGGMCSKGSPRGRGGETRGGEGGVYDSGSSSAADGDEAVWTRPRREKKYNYPEMPVEEVADLSPDLQHPRAVEDVPSPVTQDTPSLFQDTSAFHLQGDEALRLAVSSDFSFRPSGGEQRELFSPLRASSASSLRQTPAAVAGESSRPASPSSLRSTSPASRHDLLALTEEQQEDEEEVQQRQGEQQRDSDERFTAGAEEGQAVSEVVSATDVKGTKEKEESKGLTSTLENKELHLQQQQQRLPQPRRRQAKAESGSQQRRLTIAGEGAEEKIKKGKQKKREEGGAGSGKLSHATFMDLSLEMQGHMHVTDGGKALSSFMRDVAAQASARVAFSETHARLHITTGVGELVLEDVQLDGEEDLQGMASLRDVTVDRFTVLGEADEGRTWLLETRVVFPPVPTGVFVGDLGLRLSFQGVDLGWMAGRNVKMEEGGKAVTFLGVLQPPEDATEVVSRFFSAALDEEEGDLAEAGGSNVVKVGRPLVVGHATALAAEAKVLAGERTPVSTRASTEQEEGTGEAAACREEGAAEGCSRGSRREGKGEVTIGLGRRRKERPKMDVVITGEGVRRVTEAMVRAAAAAEEGLQKTASAVRAALQQQKDEEEGEETQQRVPKRIIPWIAGGLEGLTMSVPVPTLGSASGMIKHISMEGMRLDLTNAREEAGEAAASGRATLTADVARRRRGEHVPMEGMVQLVVANPLGSRVIPHILQVEMDVLLLADLPAEEAAFVPTPSGHMQPVSGFGKLAGSSAKAAAAGGGGGAAGGKAGEGGSAAGGGGGVATGGVGGVATGGRGGVAAAEGREVSAAGDGGVAGAGASRRKVPVGTMKAVLPGVKVTPLTLAAARVWLTDAQAPASGQAVGAAAGVGLRSSSRSRHEGSLVDLTAPSVVLEDDEETDEGEEGAMLLLQVPLAAALQLIGDGDSFTDFVVAVFKSSAVPLTFQGEAACMMRTGFGDVNVKGIDVRATFSIKGLEGLQGSSVTSLEIEGVGDIEDYIQRKRAGRATNRRLSSATGEREGREGGAREDEREEGTEEETPRVNSVTAVSGLDFDAAAAAAFAGTGVAERGTEDYERKTDIKGGTVGRKLAAAVAHALGDALSTAGGFTLAVGGGRAPTRQLSGRASRRDEEVQKEAGKSAAGELQRSGIPSGNAVAFDSAAAAAASSDTAAGQRRTAAPSTAQQQQQQPRGVRPAAARSINVSASNSVVSQPRAADAAAQSRRRADASLPSTSRQSSFSAPPAMLLERSPQMPPQQRADGYAAAGEGRPYGKQRVASYSNSSIQTGYLGDTESGGEDIEYNRDSWTRGEDEADEKAAALRAAETAGVVTSRATAAGEGDAAEASRASKESAAAAAAAARDQGLLLSLNVEMMHAGDAAVDMGTLDVDLYHLGTRVGCMSSSSASATLLPGSNTLTFVGGIILSPRTESAVSSLFSRSMRNEDLDVQTRMASPSTAARAAGREEAAGAAARGEVAAAGAAGGEAAATGAATGRSLLPSRRPNWLVQAMNRIQIMPAIPPLSRLLPGFTTADLLQDFELASIVIKELGPAEEDVAATSTLSSRRGAVSTSFFDAEEEAAASFHEGEEAEEREGGRRDVSAAAGGQSTPPWSHPSPRPSQAAAWRTLGQQERQRRQQEEEEEEGDVQALEEQKERRKKEEEHTGRGKGKTRGTKGSDEASGPADGRRLTAVQKEENDDFSSSFPRVSSSQRNPHSPARAESSPPDMRNDPKKAAEKVQLYFRAEDLPSPFPPLYLDIHSRSTSLQDLHFSPTRAQSEGALYSPPRPNDLQGNPLFSFPLSADTASAGTTSGQAAVRPSRRTYSGLPYFAILSEGGGTASSGRSQLQRRKSATAAVPQRCGFTAAAQQEGGGKGGGRDAASAPRGRSSAGQPEKTATQRRGEEDETAGGASPCPRGESHSGEHLHFDDTHSYNSEWILPSATGATQHMSLSLSQDFTFSSIEQGTDDIEENETSPASDLFLPTSGARSQVYSPSHHVGGVRRDNIVRSSAFDEREEKRFPFLPDGGSQDQHGKVYPMARYLQSNSESEDESDYEGDETDRSNTSLMSSLFIPRMVFSATSHVHAINPFGRSVVPLQVKAVTFKASIYSSTAAAPAAGDKQQQQQSREPDAGEPGRQTPESLQGDERGLLGMLVIPQTPVRAAEAVPEEREEGNEKEEKNTAAAAGGKGASEGDRHAPAERYSPGVGRAGTTRRLSRLHTPVHFPADGEEEEEAETAEAQGRDREGGVTEGKGQEEGEGGGGAGRGGGETEGVGGAEGRKGEIAQGEGKEAEQEEKAGGGEVAANRGGGGAAGGGAGGAGTTGKSKAPAAAGDKNMDFTFEVSSAALLLEDGGEPLGAAVAAFLKHPGRGFPLYMKGTANVQVDIGHGLASLWISGIPLERHFTLGDTKQEDDADPKAAEETGAALQMVDSPLVEERNKTKEKGKEKDIKKSDMLFNTSMTSFAFDGFNFQSGMRFSATAKMQNSMPVTMTLPRLLFDIYYRGAHLGYVWTQRPVRMRPSPESTVLHLRGKLLRQTEPQRLARLNELAAAILSSSSGVAAAAAAGAAFGGSASSAPTSPAAATADAAAVNADTAAVEGEEEILGDGERTNAAGSGEGTTAGGAFHSRLSPAGSGGGSFSLPESGNGGEKGGADSPAAAAVARPQVLVRPQLNEALLRLFMREDEQINFVRREETAAAMSSTRERAEKEWEEEETQQEEEVEEEEQNGGSFFLPMPFWLQRALTDLEIPAPIEGEKLFPAADFVRHVSMKKIVVHAEKGPLEPLVVEADMQLELINPFDGSRSSRLPLSSEALQYAVSEGSPYHIPTFRVDSLELTASLAAACSSQGEEGGASAGVAFSGAAALGSSSRPTRARVSSSSNSVEERRCSGGGRTYAATLCGRFRSSPLNSGSSLSASLNFSPHSSNRPLSSGPPTGDSDAAAKPAVPLFTAVPDDVPSAVSSAASSPTQRRLAANEKEEEEKAAAAARLASISARATENSPGGLFSIPLSVEELAAAGGRTARRTPAVVDGEGAEDFLASSLERVARRTPSFFTSMSLPAWGEGGEYDALLTKENTLPKLPLREELLLQHSKLQTEDKPQDRVLDWVQQNNKHPNEEQRGREDAGSSYSSSSKGFYWPRRSRTYANPLAAEEQLHCNVATTSCGRSLSLSEGGGGEAARAGTYGSTCVPRDIYERESWEKDMLLRGGKIGQRTAELQLAALRHREQGLQLQLEGLRVQQRQQQQGQQLEQQQTQAQQQREVEISLLEQQLAGVQSARREKEEAATVFLNRIGERGGTCILNLPFTGEVHVVDEAAFAALALESVALSDFASCPATESSSDWATTAAGAEEGERAAREAAVAGPAPQPGLQGADQADALEGSSSSSNTAVGCRRRSSSASDGWKKGSGLVVEGVAAVFVETPLGRLMVGRVPVVQQLQLEQMKDIVNSASQRVKMLNFQVSKVILGGEEQGAMDRLHFTASVQLGSSSDDESSSKEMVATRRMGPAGDAGAGRQRRTSQGEGDETAAVSEGRGRDAREISSGPQVEVHAGTLKLELVMEEKVVGVITAKDAVLGGGGGSSTTAETVNSRGGGGAAPAETYKSSPPLQIEGMLQDVSESRGKRESKLLQLMQSAVSGSPMPLLLRSAKEQQDTRPAWLLNVIDSMQLRPSLSGVMSSLALVENLQLRNVKIRVLDSRRLGMDATAVVAAANPLGSTAGVEVQLQHFSADVRLFQKAALKPQKKQFLLKRRGAPQLSALRIPSWLERQSQQHMESEQQQDRKRQRERGIDVAETREGEKEKAEEQQRGDLLLGVLKLKNRPVPRIENSSRRRGAEEGEKAGERGKEKAGEGQLLFEVPLSYDLYGDHLELEGDGLAFGDFLTRVVHFDAAAAATASRGATAGSKGGGEETPAQIGLVRYEAIVNADVDTTFGPLTIDSLPVSSELNILDSLLPAKDAASPPPAQKQKVSESQQEQRQQQQPQKQQQQQQQQRATAAGSTTLSGGGLLNDVNFTLQSLEIIGDREEEPAGADVPGAKAAAAFFRHVKQFPAKEKRSEEEAREEKSSSRSGEGLGFKADVALRVPLDVDLSLGTLVFRLEVPAEDNSEHLQGSATAGNEAASAAAYALVAEQERGKPVRQETGGVAKQETGGAAERRLGGGAETFSPPFDAAATPEETEGVEALGAGAEALRAGAATEPDLPLRSPPPPVVGRQWETRRTPAEVPLHQQPQPQPQEGEQQRQPQRRGEARSTGTSEEETVLLGWLVVPSMVVRAREESVVRAEGFIKPEPAAMHVVSKFFSACVRGEQPLVIVKGVTAILPTDSEEETEAAAAAAAVAARESPAAASGAAAPATEAAAAYFGSHSSNWLQRLVKTLKVPAPVPPSMSSFVEGSFADLKTHHMSLSAVSPSVLGRDDRVSIGASVSAQLSSPLGANSPLLLQSVSIQVKLLKKKTPSAASPAEEGHQVPPLQQFRKETEAETASHGAIAGGAEEEESALELVGELHQSSLPFQQKGMALQVELHDAVLMLKDSGDAFSRLAVDLMNTGDVVSVYVKGQASVVVETVLGILQLEGLPLKVDMPVKGMAIFDAASLGSLTEGALQHLQVRDINRKEWRESERRSRSSSSSASSSTRHSRRTPWTVFAAAADDSAGAADTSTREEREEEEEGEEGDSGAFHLSTQLVMQNHNDVSVDLGDMLFEVSFKGETIAAVVVRRFRMGPGSNNIYLEGVVKPEGLDTFSELASAFFIQSQYTLGIRGLGGGAEEKKEAAGLARGAEFAESSAAAAGEAARAGGAGAGVARQSGGVGAAALSAASSSAGGDADNFYSSFFSNSAAQPSQAALLAVRRCGITTRPPRWLRMVLSRVQFSVPIQGKEGIVTPNASSSDSSGERSNEEDEGEFSVGKLVKEVQVLSVDVDFSGPRDPVIGGNLRVLYHIPEKFQIEHTVESMTSTVKLLHDSTGKGEQSIGSLQLRDIQPQFSGITPAAEVGLQQQKEPEPRRQLLQMGEDLVAEGEEINVRESKRQKGLSFIRKVTEMKRQPPRDEKKEKKEEGEQTQQKEQKWKKLAAALFFNRKERPKSAAPSTSPSTPPYEDPINIAGFSLEERQRQQGARSKMKKLPFLFFERKPSTTSKSSAITSAFPSSGVSSGKETQKQTRKWSATLSPYSSTSSAADPAAAAAVVLPSSQQNRTSLSLPPGQQPPSTTLSSHSGAASFPSTSSLLVDAATQPTPTSSKRPSSFVADGPVAASVSNAVFTPTLITPSGSAVDVSAASDAAKTSAHGAGKEEKGAKSGGQWIGQRMLLRMMREWQEKRKEEKRKAEEKKAQEKKTSGGSEDRRLAAARDASEEEDKTAAVGAAGGAETAGGEAAAEAAAGGSGSWGGTRRGPATSVSGSLLRGSQSPVYEAGGKQQEEGQNEVETGSRASLGVNEEKETASRRSEETPSALVPPSKTEVDIAKRRQTMPSAAVLPDARAATAGTATVAAGARGEVTADGGAIAASNSVMARLDFTLSQVTLEIEPGAEEKMAAMLTEMVKKTGMMGVRVIGIADLVLKTAVGRLHLQNIPVNLLQRFKCIGGLQRSGAEKLFNMSHFAVNKGTPESLHTSARLRLLMPEAVSQYSVRLGKVQLQLYMPVTPQQQQRFGDFQLLAPQSRVKIHPHEPLKWIAKVGDIHVDDLVIPSKQQREEALEKQQDLFLVGQAVLHAPMVDVDGVQVQLGTRVLMSNYMNGRVTPILVKGSKESSRNPVVSSFFNSMELPINLPGTPEKLVKNIEVLGLEHMSVRAATWFFNPMKAVVRLYHASFIVKIGSQELPRIVIDNRRNPEILAPETVSKSQPVLLPIKPEMLLGALSIMGNRIFSKKAGHVQATGSVDVGIEEYHVTLDLHVKELAVKMPDLNRE